MQEILTDVADVLIPNEKLNKFVLNELKKSLDPVAKKTPLGALHVDGLKVDQVWVQAQMVLDAVGSVKEGVDSDLESEGSADSDLSGEEFSGIEGEEEEEEEEDLDEELEESDMEGLEDEPEHSDLDEPDLDEPDLDEPDLDEPEHSDSASDSANAKDNFDLGTFQQHVLALEDPSDVDIDWNAPVPNSDESDFNDFFEEGADEPKQDLFMESEESEIEDMSKFERQQQELAKQIADLERENVGEKEWAMKGEASAKDRPEEGLFNLQFERNVKAAPVITEESTKSLEDIIKERIRLGKFDSVLRRTEHKKEAKKELAELSDQKSQKSLAELYEEDIQRKENPEYFKQVDNEQLTAAHKEVIELFTSLSQKLDSLCSWQYTPRADLPQIEIRGNSISMEEAQPSTMSVQDAHAPQEVFRSESAVPMANDEMTTSMKRKRRRAKAESRPKKMGKKEEMFNTLKRGNVTLVGKNGEKKELGKKQQVRKTAEDTKL